jgi:signal peptidase I
MADFDGYSMFPTLRPGDTLIVKRVDGKKGDIKLGDIVCFPEEEREKKCTKYTAHRIIEIREGEKDITIRTKGDNLINPDPTRVINGDGILKVMMIKRGEKGFIKLRFGGLLARLSSLNLTFGIVKGWIGRGVRRFLFR